MYRMLIAGISVAAAVTLAACGGGSDSSGGSANAAPSNMGATTVATANIGDSGRVLVDSQGQALYASDQEASGKIMCTDACLSFWQPLTVKNAPTGGSITGKLGTVNRPDDGSRQVTFNGMPLYTFSQEGPGEVTGDGFHDAFNGQQFTWNVVSLANAASSSSQSSSSSSSGSGLSY